MNERLIRVAPCSFFPVDYESNERQVAHLEVYEKDVPEGQGFPPPRAVVPLVIAAAE